MSRNCSITARDRVDGFLAMPYRSSMAVTTLTAISSRTVDRIRVTAFGARPRSARLTVLVSSKYTSLVVFERVGPRYILQLGVNPCPAE